MTKSRRTSTKEEPPGHSSFASLPKQNAPSFPSQRFLSLLVFQLHYDYFVSMRLFSELVKIKEK